jgi:hypothetical protein
MATLGFLKELCILIVAYNCITTHPRSIVRLLAQLSRCTMLFEHECQLRREVSLRHFYGYTCVFQGSVYFDSTIHMLHHELEIDGSRRLTFLDLVIHLLRGRHSVLEMDIAFRILSTLLSSGMQGSNGARSNQTTISS